MKLQAALVLAFVLFGIFPHARPALAEIRVEAQPGTERWAKSALETVRRAKAGVERRLGLPVPDDFTVLLARDTKSFAKIVGPAMAAYAAAAAVPDAGLVVVNVARIDVIPPNTMAASLRHELAHLAEHRAARGTLPLWLDEGVACWTAGRVYLADLADLRERAALNALLPLENLTDAFPEDRRALSLAYLESESFVSFLIARFGLDKLRDLIREISARNPDRALTRIYGRNLASLEEEWKEQITPPFPVLYIAFRKLGLWGWMAIATIIVALLVRWKAERKKREWDREEWDEWDDDDEGSGADGGKIYRLQ